MTLVRWNPVRELASMEIDKLNSMFSDFYGGIDRAWVPAVDVYENNDHEFVLKAELPEMKRENISITFDNGVLTLKGERTADLETTRENYHRIERQHGTFTRSFPLPRRWATVDGSRSRDVALPRHHPNHPTDVTVASDASNHRTRRRTCFTQKFSITQRERCLWMLSGGWIASSASPGGGRGAWMPTLLGTP